VAPAVVAAGGWGYADHEWDVITVGWLRGRIWAIAARFRDAGRHDHAPIHRRKRDRHRRRSRFNTLKITDCVNAFTLVFCGHAYGDGVPKPFRPSTNRDQP
jgi:hypothetical protein